MDLISFLFWKKKNIYTFIIYIYINIRILFILLGCFDRLKGFVLDMNSRWCYCRYSAIWIDVIQDMALSNSWSRFEPFPTLLELNRPRHSKDCSSQRRFRSIQVHGAGREMQWKKNVGADVRRFSPDVLAEATSYDGRQAQEDWNLEIPEG